MIYAGIALLLAAATLSTRYGRLRLALLLLRTARRLGDLGENCLDNVTRERRP